MTGLVYFAAGSIITFIAMSVLYWKLVQVVASHHGAEITRKMAKRTLKHWDRPEHARKMLEAFVTEADKVLLENTKKYGDL